MNALVVVAGVLCLIGAWNVWVGPRDPPQVSGFGALLRPEYAKWWLIAALVLLGLGYGVGSDGA